MPGKPRVVASRENGPPLGDLSGPFLLALLGGDEAAVEELVGRARTRGADTALLVRDLVGPALSEVGRMWTRGEASIAEEHLATALVGRVLPRTACAGCSGASPRRRIVLACLAGEFHDLGVRLLADVAREAGWEAESLGANVPREALVRFLAQRAPDAVALSVSLAGHVPEAARTVAEIREAAPSTAVLVGGLAFHEEPERVALTGADAGIADAVALRDWLRARAAGARKAGARSLPAEMPAALRRRVARPR